MYFNVFRVDTVFEATSSKKHSIYHHFMPKNGPGASVCD